MTQQRIKIMNKRIKELERMESIFVSEISFKNNAIKNLLSILEGQEKQRELIMQKLLFLENKIVVDKS